MTKKTKVLCSLVVFCLVMLISGVNSYALNTGFTYDEISESRKESCIDSIKLTLVSEAPSGRSIVTFDVNEKGMIALGHDLPNLKKKISIYDSEGNFKYGYSFETHGSFNVEWDGDYLNIYFVRSDYLVTVDSDANIIDIVEVQNTRENQKYSMYYLGGTERVVGDTKYTIRSDMGIFSFMQSSYSRLVKTSSDGTETILYDVNSILFAKRLIITISVSMLVCVSLYIIFKPLLLNKEAND